jgi:sucrose-phosphate synthase
MELGKDNDTGGQIKYVVELAKALSSSPDVDRVDLITRQVFGKNIDSSYAEPLEQIAEKSFIVRVPCGPRRYLRKETLWPHLDSLSDRIVHHIRQVGRVPDIIHGHYADAGYVGAQLARLLGVPFVFTGHSLGRVKRERLQMKGLSAESINKKYQFKRRIEAEETSLDTAALVVASTSQEIEEQYGLYDHYAPKRMCVIPPGVDLSRFSPPQENDTAEAYLKELERFLRDPDKPMILAIARPDERKNFPTLLRAYAENKKLRKLANLVLIAGNRENLLNLQPGSRKVLRNLMMMIDQYDLYGSVAYPKQHSAEDIPDLYRLAARTKGIFVNPALTEPFGLTLIEAAASGLPLVAPNDGGPRDIIGALDNGVLIDPLDSEAMGNEILALVEDKELWQKRSHSGSSRVDKCFSWNGHVDTYIDKIHELLKNSKEDPQTFNLGRARLTIIDRILVTTIDNVLVGDDAALQLFLKELNACGEQVGFCVTTSKSSEEALKLLEENNIPLPDVLICSGGTEIFYGRWLVPDRAWKKHIDYKWRPDAVEEQMASFPDVKLIKREEFRFRYSYKSDSKLSKRQIASHLRHAGLRANIVLISDTEFEILPIRISMSLAIRYLTFKWGVPPDRLLLAAHAGINEDRLAGNTLGVVVGPQRKKRRKKNELSRIFHSEKSHAWGLLDGINHYDFFGSINIPGEDDDEESPPSLNVKDHQESHRSNV